MTTRWLQLALARIHALAAEQKVVFTYKALRELALLDAGLDAEDAIDVLRQLSAADSTGRTASRLTGEWLYVFKPRVAETVLYVKLILRADCVVVSFHEDVDADEVPEQEDDE
jgi:hypothetical protein